MSSNRYITGSVCGTCETTKIKIDHILKRFPKGNSGEINVEKHLDLAGANNHILCLFFCFI